MPRSGLHRDDIVDAITSAAVGITWNHRYTLAELPRLMEAGALPDTVIEISLGSSLRSDRVELQGELAGRLILTCQRCLQPVEFAVSEPIALRVMRSEDQAQQQGEDEYIIADPARLDLRWLSEEQALLALPLVPMHAPDQCSQASATTDQNAGRESGIAQSPFANLRDMLDKS